MKTPFTIIVPAALAIIAASCTQEINTEPIHANVRRYSLTIDQTTKTELSGTSSKRHVNWTDGDAIEYYTESGQSSAVIAAVSIDGSNAYVEIPRGRTDEFINAVYGATQLKSTSSTENTMYVSSPVKDNQHYTSFAQAHLCAAFSDDLEHPNLKFHNAASVLGFTSTSAIKKIIFYGNNNEVITGGSNGDLKISYSGGVLTTAVSSNGGTSVTVQTNGADSDFYIAILPVRFPGGFTVDCYDESLDLVVSQKMSAPVNAITDNGTPKVINLGKVQDWMANPQPVAVDLGLSVKWASYNVGAAQPEEYGDYFAWGETSPKSEYKWANYSYGTGKNGPFSEYVLDANYGTVDHKTILDLEDDAAHASWGGDWRMPSQEEFEELRDNCTWTWTQKNGVNGYRVTSKKSGYTDNSFFLPANGMYSGSSASDVGTIGNYWSASSSEENTYHAISPYFSSSYVKSGNCYRYFGLGVRPVEGAIVPVASIDMQTSLDLILGRTATLHATISPSNATYKGITWSSSDESIATVDAAGKVTVVSMGNATITAYSADASTTASCEVAVYQLAQSITLDKTELEMCVGDAPVTLTATVLPDEYTMKNLTWSSAYPSIATVDSDGKITAVSKGSTKITVKANDGSNVSAACMVTVKTIRTDTNGYDYVDLGLPSGLKWATMNVGATKPEEYGDHFAWGETQPKDNYTLSTYKWCNGAGNKLTKYCTKSSSWDSAEPMDNKTTLDLEDDAARANWGGSWRMPTAAEWTELRENCTWTWTKQNGVYGRLVTSKTNSNSIFLPAAGHRYDTRLSKVGSSGYYWSSSLITDSPDNAWGADFSLGYNWGGYRSYGFSVRPVTE